MKKSTNKYRRCANCPHKSNLQQKCCCQRNSVSSRPRPMTSRIKREPSTIDNSSALNTTIPTIIAQFSALRTENNQLKRQLLNVSTFIKQEHCDSQAHSNDISLSQKLFLANKNLKQSLLEIDTISKANKQLCERNSYLVEQCQGLKIQLRQVQDYLDKYKKKCKKMTKEQENLASKDDIDQALQHNAQLEQQIKSLREEIRCLRFQNINFNMLGNLSPQWVAHTGNKLKLQENLQKGEQAQRQQIQIWKRSLSQTINVLRNVGTHLSSTSLEGSGVGCLNALLEQFLETYSQSILTHFQLLMKQINRKINNYQKKMNNLASKLENFLLGFRNKKLRKKVHSQITTIKTERLPMNDLTNRIL